MTLSYVASSANFVFRERAGTDYLGEAKFEGINHAVDKAVYIQQGSSLDEQQIDKIDAYTIEIEKSQAVGARMHLRLLKFANPAPKVINIVQHSSIVLTLDEFLDCPIEITTVEQIKGEPTRHNQSTQNQIFLIATNQNVGSFYLGPKTRFYIFIDDFYYKTIFDLVQHNYKLREQIKWRHNAKKVEFPKGTQSSERPLEEKISECCTFKCPTRF